MLFLSSAPTRTGNDLMVPTRPIRDRALDGKVSSLRNREPPRVYRRLHSLRGWGHGETEPVFSGGAGASGADGVRAYPGPRIAVGGDHLDRREDRVCGRDAAELGATGRA